MAEVASNTPRQGHDQGQDFSAWQAAAEILMKARASGQIESWPPALGPLPDGTDSVRMAFDRITPIRLMAETSGWSFDELLTEIAGIGAEQVHGLLEQDRVVRVHTEADELRRQRGVSEAGGSKGGQHNRLEKVNRIAEAREHLKKYHANPYLQGEHRTPAVYLQHRMKVSDRTARSYVNEISGK